ncbi:MAG: methyl-accepting chemotaxis protein, partial [Desulfobacterales bacterium]|nr:methyl-accepting chemotaxis protein [Desulfobacterales bacterium]
MLKNLKLGTIVICGFAVVLMLTAIVGYVGYNGMSGIADKVEKVDDVTRMIESVLGARRQEKNFIIRGGKEYIDKVAKEIAAIRKQANETRGKFKDTANKRQMDEVLSATDGYEKGFALLVDLTEKQAAADKKMVQAARAFLKTTGEIRQEQKADYKKLRNENAAEAKLDDKLTKSDDADQLIKWALEARRQEKNFIIRGEKEYVDKVARRVEDILNLAMDMRSRFRQAKNRAQADRVISSAKEYKAGFDEVVGFIEKKGDADKEMVAAARLALNVCNKASSDQKAAKEAQMSTSVKTVFAGAIVAILLGLGFAFTITKTISGGIGKLVGNIDQIADDAANGKLDSRADVEAVGIDFKAIPAGFNNVLDAVIGPLNVAAEYVDRISKGDIPEKITDEYRGDFNEIKNNLNQCVDAVNALVADADMLAQAAVEGKLDTRADASKHGGDFAKIVDGVNNTLDAVIGPLNVAAEYVDRISKGDIPEKITDEYRGDFNEIKNNLNQCVDAINGLVAEAGMLVRAAMEGKLATRGDVSKYSGDYAKIVEGVNDTLDAVVGPLNVAADYVDRISKGDIPQKITDEYKGDFNEIKNNLNQCVDAVNALVADANMLAQAAVEGKLDTRADASKHGGDYGKIVHGVNETLDAVIGPLNVAAEYVDRISKGDIPEKITDEYRGDFNEIKNNLNQCVDAINGLVAEAGMLVQAAVEGRLATRGDASKYGGDYAKIVQGVNETLDAVIGPLNVAAEYVDSISKGDIPQKITDEYKGDFNDIKNNLNRCIDAVNLLVDDAGILAQAAIEGKLETRADASKHGGDFAKIVEGVNDTLDAVIGPLNVAADYVDRISNGDIPDKIIDEYRGDFNVIKNNLNQCIDALRGLIVEDGGVAIDAAANKDMTARLKRDYQGAYATMKDNINMLIENLQDALAQVATAADEVGSGSGQVASSSQELAEGSAEQAASLEETSSSLEEMSSMVKQNAENANQANNLMMQANQVVDRAKDSMGELTNSMDDISKASEETQK